MGRFFLGLTVVALLMAPTLAAQPHDHGDDEPTQLVILHEMEEDHRLAVGQASSFGYAFLTEDGKPTTHKEGRIRIVQNDVLLYETHTVSSGHDYDGLNTFVYTFAVPGPFVIEAAVPVGGQLHTNVLQGEVVPLRVDASAPTLAYRGPDVALEGTQHMFGFELEDGPRSGHGYAGTAEVRRASDSALTLRLPIAGDADAASPPAFSHRFLADDWQADDGYGISAVASPVPRQGPGSYASVTATGQVAVTRAAPPTSGSVAILPEADCDASTGANGPDVDVFPMYDPESTVGLYGPVRLSGLILHNGTTRPYQGAYFEASLIRLTSADDGPIFAGSGRDLDGVVEVVYAPPSTGSYVFCLYVASEPPGAEASDGPVFNRTLAMPFEVVPAGSSGGAAAGPVLVDVDRPSNLTSGAPMRFSFMMRNAAGTPVPHSEIDFRIAYDEPTGTPLVQNKIHTHADGFMGFNVTFPVAGTYHLVLDPLTLEGEPATSYELAQAPGGRILTLQVAPGPPLPSPGPTLEGEEVPPTEGQTPGPSIVLVLAALVSGLGASVRNLRRHDR